MSIFHPAGLGNIYILLDDIKLASQPASSFSYTHTYIHIIYFYFLYGIGRVLAIVSGQRVDLPRYQHGRVDGVHPPHTNEKREKDG